MSLIYNDFISDRIKAALVNEAAIEDNIGRFPCTDGDTVFTSNSSLTTHKRIHTGRITSLFFIF